MKLYNGGPHITKQTQFIPREKIVICGGRNMITQLNREKISHCSPFFHFLLKNITSIWHVEKVSNVQYMEKLFKIIPSESTNISLSSFKIWKSWQLIQKKRCFWLLRLQFFNFFSVMLSPGYLSMHYHVFNWWHSQRPTLNYVQRGTFFREDLVLHSQVMTTLRWCVIDFRQKKPQLLSTMNKKKTFIVDQ